MGGLYLGSTPVAIPGMGGSATGLDAFEAVHGGTAQTAATVTAGDPANTKGAWTEMIASAPGDANLMLLYPWVGANGVDTSTLVDVGVGAVGAEVVKVPDLAVGGIIVQYPVVVPISVASGDRVALRIQGGIASRPSTWNAHLFSMPTALTSSDGTVDVLGTDTSTSRGTLVSSGMGWVEVAASTSRAYKNLVVVPSISHATSNPQAGSYLCVGTGASGSEVESARVYPRYSNTESVASDQTLPNPILTSVGPGCPAGSRIAVATSSAFSTYACVIGVPA